MIKTLTTFGLLAVAGASSLCDLCGSGAARFASAPRGLVTVGYAAPMRAPRQAGAPTLGKPGTTTRTITLAVKGMTCGGCVVGTRTVLTRLPGVSTAAVSYAKGTAVVTYDPQKVTVEQMIAAIKKLGYTATPVAS